MVLARSRNRPPVPPPDPVRDAFATLLEEPTPGGVHEVMGAFVLRELAWTRFWAAYTAGSCVAVAAATVYLLIPLDLPSFAEQLAAVALLLAAPCAGLAIWLRLQRDDSFRRRREFAEAMAELLEDLVRRLPQEPCVDARLRSEALRLAGPFPRIHDAIERLVYPKGKAN